MNVQRCMFSIDSTKHDMTARKDSAMMDNVSRRNRKRNTALTNIKNDRNYS